MAKKAKTKKFLQNRQDKRTVQHQLKQRRKTMTTKHDDDDDRKAGSEKAKREAEQKAKQRAADQDPVTEQIVQNTDKSAEELMSTPEVSPAPNPPSPPGGEMIGDPTELVPHSEPEEKSLKEQRPTNPGPGERQRLTDEDRQR